MKRELPYDWSRCNPTSSECARKAQCARFTSPGRPHGWQVMLDFSALMSDGGTSCGHFESNELEAAR